jgi:hypothetical protein
MLIRVQFLKSILLLIYCNLNDLSDKIILFSDRPHRVVQAQSIDDFIGNWSSGSDSFQADPPNAALVILAGGKEDVLEVELLNSHYDRDENRLSYNLQFYFS